MSKLTKIEIAAHDKALGLLNHERLTDDDVRFIYKNYREDANHVNSKAGAYFTPLDLARDLAIHIPFAYNDTVRIIDLCAGIGVLSYAAFMSNIGRTHCRFDITCVEINPDYVEIGKILLPDAKWICGDASDLDMLGSLGRFDFAISNPPFGTFPVKCGKIRDNGPFEYTIIKTAAQIADEGAFIIPQMSAPFVYSGSNNHRWLSCGKANIFEEKTGISLEFNLGIDTADYKNDWHGVAPVCEIVCCDFSERTGQLSMDMVQIA